MACKPCLQLTRRSVGDTSNVCRKLLDAFLTFSSVEISSVPESTYNDDESMNKSYVQYKNTSACNNRVYLCNNKRLCFLFIQTIKQGQQIGCLSASVSLYRSALKHSLSIQPHAISAFFSVSATATCRLVPFTRRNRMR